MSRLNPPKAGPLAEMAAEYVELLDSQPNGWGQHVHPVYGISHRMLYLMQITYGVGEASKAIDAAHKARAR